MTAPQVLDLSRGLDYGFLGEWSRVYHKLNGAVLPGGYSEFWGMPDLDIRAFYGVLGEHYRVAVQARQWGVLAGENGAGITLQDDRHSTVLAPLEADAPLIVEAAGHPYEITAGYGLVAPRGLRVALRPYGGRRIALARWLMVLHKGAGGGRRGRRSGGAPSGVGYVSHAFVGDNERAALLAYLDSLPLSNGEAVVTPTAEPVSDVFQRMRARMHELSRVRLADQCFGSMKYRVTENGAWERHGTRGTKTGALASILLSAAAAGGAFRTGGGGR